MKFLPGDASYAFPAGQESNSVQLCTRAFIFIHLGSRRYLHAHPSHSLSYSGSGARNFVPRARTRLFSHFPRFIKISRVSLIFIRATGACERLEGIRERVTGKKNSRECEECVGART